MISFEESTAFPKGIVPNLQKHSFYRGVPGASNPSKVPEVQNVKGDVTTPNVSYEEGIELLRTFIRKGNGHHTLLMQHEDGTYHHSDRDGQPCYGSMRTYGTASNRPYDYWPADLRTPHRVFPEGKPVAVGLIMRVNEIWFSEASPWRQLFKKIEVVKHNNQVMGIIFLDTEVDPTLLVSFAKHYGYCGYIMNTFDNRKNDKDFLKLDPRIQFFAGMVVGRLETMNWGFGLGLAPDYARIIQGEMLPGIAKETFTQRGAYNRPVVDHVFGFDESIKASLPPIFKSWSHAQDYLLNMKIKEYV